MKSNKNNKKNVVVENKSIELALVVTVVLFVVHNSHNSTSYRGNIKKYGKSTTDGWIVQQLTEEGSKESFVKKEQPTLIITT